MKNCQKKEKERGQMGWKKVLKKPKFLLFAILALALLVRLAHWIAVRDDPFFAQLIMDSHEYDRWARDIAGGNWLGTEVFFQAPLYPYLLAIIYKIFGRSLDVVYLIQIFLAVTGCYALYRAGKKFIGEKEGLAAAAIAALYAVFIFYDIQVLKESMAVTVVCFLLWVLAEAREKGKARIWLLVGILCGILCLLRENTLLILPVFFLFALKRHESKRLFLLKSGMVLAGVLVVLSPVAIRNWVVGGYFMPTTFQGGVNFYIGNNPESTGTYQPIVRGKQIPHYERNEPIRIAEQEMGRPLSPPEVSNFWLKKSLLWAMKHPFEFIRLQLKKILMFWSWYEWPDAVDYYYVKKTSLILRIPLFEFGCVFILSVIGLWLLRDRIRDIFPVPVFIVVWMVSTIIFFLFSRYRLPALPALILLAAVPLVFLYEAWRGKLFLKAGILSFCFVVAFVAPHVAGFKPRMDIVNYNLALVYEKLGQLDKAEEHYSQALRDNPDDFLSLINLGNHAARRQDWLSALEWYKKAEAIEPDLDGIHGNLGGAYVALDRLDEAEVHFTKALELNPKNIPAHYNMAILLAKKGELDKSLELIQKVLELSPDFVPALRFKAKLEQLLTKR
jgi:4-amino-4-deoxy-L-arabinose transferase-like glycosyltransferase